jgi:hypothetical protein
MLVIKRKSAGCGFNIISNNKNYKSLKRGKLSGQGINHDLIASASNKPLPKNTSKIGEGIITKPKIKKYISLNL